MFDSFFQPTWLDVCLIALLLTHITIVSVTIFLHRHQAHRSVELHGLISHFFRLWLWLTTATVTREWVAVHRKHHARVETSEDPHSPQANGIFRVLFLGAWLYRLEACKSETLAQFGHGTPKDWIEENIYTRFTLLGPVLMLVANVTFFGTAKGLVIWSIQILWIPLWAAGVINGVGHFLGYRNFQTLDASRNILPWGILIGGEELHNNHHAYASSAKLSVRPWEFDIGWFYISILRILRLATVNRTVPQLVQQTEHQYCDADTVKAIINNKIQVMADFLKLVVDGVYREEVGNAATNKVRKRLKHARALLHREWPTPDADLLLNLEKQLEASPKLNEVYSMKLRLQEIWSNNQNSGESMIDRLEEWCTHAEESGIQLLQEFASRLKGYRLANAAANS